MWYLRDIFFGLDLRYVLRQLLSHVGPCFTLSHISVPGWCSNRRWIIATWFRQLSSCLSHSTVWKCSSISQVGYIAKYYEKGLYTSNSNPIYSQILLLNNLVPLWRLWSYNHSHTEWSSPGKLVLSSNPAGEGWRDHFLKPIFDRKPAQSVFKFWAVPYA